MRTVAIIGVIALAFFAGQVLGAPTAKYLIDSIPGEDILIHLDEWFATHPIKEGQMNQIDRIFSSPRAELLIITTKSPKGLGRHIHITADEIIFVHKGEGEIFINGNWVPVKAGDLHVCPRGVAHATRSVPGKELMTFNILTTPMPKGGHDRVMMDE